MGFKASPVFSHDLPASAEDALRLMIGQLPIVFTIRAGGELRIPISEVDATGQYILDMEVAGADFVFKARKKS